MNNTNNISTPNKVIQLHSSHTTMPQNSIKGCKWCIKDADIRTVLHFVQKLGISDVLARILVNRGIASAIDAQSFLTPTLKSNMPDPFLLKDMDRCIKRILHAIEGGEKITVLADYDVDGVTSAAIFKRFFHQINIDIDLYIPHRIKEGYGPSVAAFREIKSRGTSLVVTVDCGIVAFEPILQARQMGLDVIVIDHHISLETLPDAIAIVNPNRLDDTYPCKKIAAVAVTFFVLTALRTSLRHRGWFIAHNVTEPNLMQFLDLVALGTMCDVMPLNGINRAFVYYGLIQISKFQNYGINAIVKHSKIEKRIDSTHLCYAIGPRINAGGRIGDGLLGAVLLSTDDHLEANKIALHLEQLNNERRTVEAIILRQAIAQIEAKNAHHYPVITVFGESWHPGIIGIIASKLKDIYHSPVVVMTVDANGLYKGSARSIPGFDIGNAILEAKSHNILVDGGGHAMAGGFSINPERLDELYEFLNAKFKKILSTDNLISEKARTLYIDSVIDFHALNHSLIAEINKAAPFGYHNEMPRFCIKNLVLKHSYVVAGMHVIASVGEQQYGVECTHKSRTVHIVKTLKIIAFRSVNTKLGEFLLHNIGQTIDVVGTCQLNNMDHNKVEIIVDDISPVL